MGVGSSAGVQAADAFVIRVDGDHEAPSVSFDGVGPGLTAREGDYEVAVTGYVLEGAGPPAERILAAFVSAGIDGVTHLDGSFGAVLANHQTGEAWAMTDPVSSRAMYAWEQPDRSVLVSNVLAGGPTAGHDLDPAGIASYLASDGMHGGLTPYKGVAAIASGSLVELVPDALTTSRYWRINPEPGRQVAEYDELREEMAHLMRRSVERRLAAADRSEVRISLSGGIDSKGLLGMLLEHTEPEAITGITYYRGDQIGDMDLPEARRVASRIGIHHQPILGYEGDFPSLLAYNALQGDSVAHFCEEGDVWRSLAKGPAEATIVVGDRQAQHASSIADMTARQILRMVSVFPVESIDWFLNRLDPEVADAMREGWGTRFEQLEADYATFGDWRKMGHPAYIEERSSRTLALWRERFSSKAGTVLNPYLDRDLLDFVAALPMELNDVEGRFLHRETILHHWPSSATGLAAHGGWNRPSWATEIQRSAGELRAVVARIDSRLEELVPKTVILDLIGEVESRGTKLSDASEGLGWQVRKAVKRSKVLTAAARKAKKRRRLTTEPRVDAATVTRELLTLHLALADHAEVEALSTRSGDWSRAHRQDDERT